MLQISIWIVLIVLSLSLLFCFYRVIVGPTLPDRVIALDAIGINMIGVIALVMIVQDTLAYADVILIIGILSFIGSIGLSKFIERGVVIDRDHH
ncbi:Na(+)/H(+) antiporter subunit F1 [Bacillus horti]|uniref:Multicomponent Na+:H+ antiporter subunit F n=1 Tax=Caldalkalibacillus horti TaxID=77523 RepID=A0ABT9VXP5_9BACI|nr:Na(+)/H(+) antiporter subunit F1 [Bacillus horti]MDQ0165649.1 multicomponent Na+:H+ antiporter subunit F [Bacillus horti]